MISEFEASGRLMIFYHSLNRDGASTGHPVEQVSRGSRIVKSLIVALISLRPSASHYPQFFRADLASRLIS